MQFMAERPAIVAAHDGGPSPRSEGTDMSEGSARAAVLAAYGAPFVVRELPLPEPEPGALLLRNEVATVCGSDVHIWEGGLEGGAVPIRPPLILGHESVGRII